MPSLGLPSWIWGVLGLGVSVMAPRSIRGPLVVVSLAAIVVAKVAADEWGCAVGTDRKMVNCGRGIFATDETRISGYDAMVQNETLIGQYMLKRANLTAGACFACMSVMQCVEMERLVDIAVSWGPAFGLETIKSYPPSPRSLTGVRRCMWTSKLEERISRG